MIAVTGATGKLGRLVVDELLKRGTKASEVVALVRSAEKAKDLLAKGIVVRESNYDKSESVEKALQGVEKLLLVSGNELGQRTRQHENVVNAAKKTGVKFIAYTSIVNADRSQMLLAKEHLATEKLIQASGIPYAILRNSWYIENYTEQFAGALEHGVIAGSAQDGKISAATRSDYAAAAVSVLLGEAKANSIYELGGKSFTMKELAGEVSTAANKQVAYKDMPQADYEKLLKGFGVPAPFAEMLADSDAGIVRGDLFTESRDLETLAHRPLTSLKEAVKNALR